MNETEVQVVNETEVQVLNEAISQTMKYSKTYSPTDHIMNEKGKTNEIKP